jgi:hypothetical protein
MGSPAYPMDEARSDRSHYHPSDRSHHHRVTQVTSPFLPSRALGRSKAQYRILAASTGEKGD